MGLDYATLALTVGLIAVIRVCVTTALYALNRRYRGIGLWACASACSALAFTGMFSQMWFDFPSAYSVTLNTLFASTLALEYAGTKLFFETKPSWRLVGFFIAGTLVGLTALMFLGDNWSLRSAFIHTVLAILSFLTAITFFYTPLHRASIISRFMGSVFAVSAAVYIASGMYSLAQFFSGTITSGPILNSELLVILVTETSLMIGFALLVSQRLATEATSVKTHFELLYQMNPEATILTDESLTITRVNEAFVAMTGLHENEVIGRNIVDIMTRNPAEFLPHIETLRRYGHQENAEIQFCKQNGDALILLTSARTLAEEGDTCVLFIARDITESKRLEEELEHQARTDVLTQLANRRQFIDLADRELARSERSGYPMSVALMDLDGMKEINDTYGHAAGDSVLITVARIGERAVRSSDLFARFGGDEFVILLPETGIAAALEVAERVCNSLLTIESPNIVPSELYRASCGVATLSPADTSLDDLLGRADAALYRAKNTGGGRVETG